MPSSSTRPDHPRRLVRSLIFVLATGAATVAAVGVGFAPSPAQADAGRGVPISSGQLVQSDDLSSIGLPFDTVSVALARDGAFSTCLGRGHSWSAVLPDSPPPLSASWTRRERRDQALNEWIVQGRDVAQAEQFTATLVRQAVRPCRQPGRGVRFGPLVTEQVGDGVVTWAVRGRAASGRADGGVAVVRQGSTVGYLELAGEFEAGQTIQSVAEAAANRLIASS